MVPQVWAPAILGYLPPSLWGSLGRCDSWLEAQALLITFVHSLGGRSMSEPTYKCLASLSMQVCEPNAKMLPCSAKHSAYHRLKKDFKQQAKHLMKPAAWVDVLPASPSDFQQAHPSTFSSVYGSEAPCPAQVNLSQLMLLDSSFRCRGEACTDKAQPAAPTGSDSTVHLLSQMVALQQQNMQLAMGTDKQLSRSGSAGHPLKSLKALANVPVAGIKRAFTIADEEDQQFPLAISDAPASAPDALGSEAGASASAPGVLGSEAAVPRPPGPLALIAPAVVDHLAGSGAPVPLATKILGDFLQMSTGLGASKHQRVVVPVAPNSLPLPVMDGSPASAPAAIMDGTQLPPPDAQQASAAGALGGTPNKASAPDASAATPAKGPPPAAQAKPAKLQKTHSAATAKRPVSVQHQRTRLNYVVRLGCGAGSTQSFPYKCGDEGSREQALALAKQFLEDALKPKQQ